jgi:hypothetical protein
MPRSGSKPRALRNSEIAGTRIYRGVHEEGHSSFRNWAHKMTQGISSAIIEIY